jgi:hypothetical protein
MERYKSYFNESSIEDLIIKITKGSGLIDKRLSTSEYNEIKKWAKSQPKPKGLIYRVVRVNLEDFFESHLYYTTQENNPLKDSPIIIKEFESWTFNRNRVYSYGSPKAGQEAVLLILDSFKIECVDISLLSVYPEEQEVRNLNKLKLKVIEANYNPSLGWQLKVERR